MYRTHLTYLYEKRDTHSFKRYIRERIEPKVQILKMNTRTSKEKKHARKMKVIIKKLNVLFKIELTGEWFLKLATDKDTIEGTASSDVIKV